MAFSQRAKGGLCKLNIDVMTSDMQYSFKNVMVKKRLFERSYVSKGIKMLAKTTHKVSLFAFLAKLAARLFTSCTSWSVCKPLRSRLTYLSDCVMDLHILHSCSPEDENPSCTLYSLQMLNANMLN